ncbi:TolC family protein [Desulfogranum japonicum]|uniref:TolC family protein n=1 Tax=Desulfogranum japonicum TaxID=231447 RepID=UPI0004020420|nr:TolC family protein [Desulfogranum japonicum]
MQFRRLGCLLLMCLMGVPLQITFAAPDELSLDKAVQLALQHNPSIDVALQQCRQGEGVLQQARSAYLPQVSLGADYGRQSIDGLTPEDEDNVGHGSIALSQLIYDFGKTTGAIDAGKFSLLATNANLQQSFLDVILLAKEAFYNVLEKQQLVEVSRETVTNYEKHLHRAKRYYEAGVRTRVDVTNAQVNLSNARLELVQAQSNLKSALVSLNRALGSNSKQDAYEVVFEHQPLHLLAQKRPAMSTSLDTLLTTAVENRPDMQQVQFLVNAAQAKVRQVKGQFLPSLQAKGRYDDYETDLSSLRDQWSLGVGLTWELFSGFRTQGEMVEAKSRFRELQAGMHELELAVTQEVTESYLRAEENSQSVTLADETLILALENLDLAEGRYKAGLNDMIEFNDAQLNLSAARTSLVSAYYGYLVSLARIEKATGVAEGLVLPEDGGLCSSPHWKEGPIKH